MAADRAFFDVVLTVEALAQADASVALLVDVHNTLIAGAINRFGRRSQRFRYLPKLVGECIGAFSLSEANSGSDAFALRTTARRVERRLRAQRFEGLGLGRPGSRALFDLRSRLRR